MKRIIVLMTTLLTMILIGSSTINANADEVRWEDIPFEYRDYAHSLQSEYGVSECLILSLCWTESKLQTDVVGGNITQITNLKWFKEGIEATGADKPKTDWKQNMRICAFYLATWFEEYEDPNIVIRGWNEGINPKVERLTDYSATVLERSARWEEEREEYEKSFGCRSPYALGEENG